MWNLNVFSILLGTSLTFSAICSATAGEKGNGGDYCTQSIVQVKKTLMASLNYAGPSVYPEFQFDVLEWYLEKATIKVVPKTVVNGEETDAKNYPSQKLIELNRGRWCTFDIESKVKILFHEYLGVMKLEASNEYPISGRLEVVRNPERYVCEFTWIRITSAYPYANEHGSARGLGTNLKDAWERAVAETHPETAVNCKKWEYKVYENVPYVDCLESARPMNSCYQQGN